MSSLLERLAEVRKSGDVARLAELSWPMSQTPMLTTPEERVAMFQQLFSDTIPHNKALGIKVLAIARGLASMQIEWRKEFVGNPETDVLAGGPLTAMLDSCCGMAVATLLKEPMPFATLDLRID